MNYTFLNSINNIQAVTAITITSIVIRMETQPSATFVEPMLMAPQIPYFTTATGLRVILVSAEKMFFSLHSKCTRVPNPSLSDPVCMKFSVVC